MALTDDLPADELMTLAARHLRRHVENVFGAACVVPGQAVTIAHDLVVADQMGMHSHGVNRVGEYLGAIEVGKIDVHGACSVVSETASTALIDGGRGFGQCIGRFALDTAERKAREAGAVVVVARNSHHIGRVGVLGELAAERGLLALALVAVGTPGRVAPLGGAEGRLGTNPIAYGVPTAAGPVVADFATSAIPEGAVKLARKLGHALPEGMLIDGAGSPTTRPEALYADPPGAIVPFGGAWSHRGYALNLMVELFGGSLGGYGPCDPDRSSNSLFLLVIDPDALLPAGDFPALAGATVDFVKSSRRVGENPVQVPGEPEARALDRSGDQVTLPSATISSLNGLAERLGLADRLTSVT